MNVVEPSYKSVAIIRLRCASGDFFNIGVLLRGNKLFSMD